MNKFVVLYNHRIIDDYSTTGGGVGLGSIQAILGNNSTAAAAATHILPLTSTTMANLGIPLTGSTAMGFTFGFVKG